VLVACSRTVTGGDSLRVLQDALALAPAAPAPAPTPAPTMAPLGLGLSLGLGLGGGGAAAAAAPPHSFVFIAAEAGSPAELIVGAADGAAHLTAVNCFRLVATAGAGAGAGSSAGGGNVVALVRCALTERVPAAAGPPCAEAAGAEGAAALLARLLAGPARGEEAGAGEGAVWGAGAGAGAGGERTLDIDVVFM
jgi:hypothetical protein